MLQPHPITTPEVHRHRKRRYSDIIPDSDDDGGFDDSELNDDEPNDDQSDDDEFDDDEFDDDDEPNEDESGDDESNYNNKLDDALDERLIVAIEEELSGDGIDSGDEPGVDEDGLLLDEEEDASIFQHRILTAPKHICGDEATMLNRLYAKAFGRLCGGLLLESRSQPVARRQSIE